MSSSDDDRRRGGLLRRLGRALQNHPAPSAAPSLLHVLISLAVAAAAIAALFIFAG